MGSTIDAVIQLRDVSVSYGKNRVIAPVTFDVPEKGVTAIMGPSGCGKSTVVRAINRMGELNHDWRLEGTVFYREEDIYDRSVEPTEIRRRLGMVFHRPNPFPKSIYDNVAFGLRVNGYDKGIIGYLVEDSLKKADLWEEVKNRLKENALKLSGGQQQR